MAYAAPGRTGGLAGDPLRTIFPNLLLERHQLPTQPLGLRDAVASTELLDRFLHKLKSRFVFGGSTGTEVPEVCAEENVGFLVVGRLAQIVVEMLGAMMKWPVTPGEAASTPLIDAVAAVRESLFTVVVTVVDPLPDPRNVNQSVVAV